ncbi:Cocaine esterase [Mactra antiquata]
MLILLCVSLLGSYKLAVSQDATVYWKYGEINGLVDTIYFDGNNHTVYKYLGIPYAKPPIGELRFKRSEPVENVQSPFYAKEFSKECVQFTFNLDFSQAIISNNPQSEDCLYLNVYVPEKQPDSTSGYAVAVWIHGGGFIGGSGSNFDGAFFSFYGNVIVVTFNYRLGPYGFLSTEDENALGNYAFWDQHVAFQWIHENIEYFGGDKERVTIFGESAGAISACHQGLITQNIGLFQRIIAQSGSPVVIAGSRFDLDAREDAMKLGSVLGCDMTTTTVLMKCLRNKSNDAIIDAMVAHKISTTGYDYVIDNQLIKREIATITDLHENQVLEEVEFYKSLDVMNGFNSHEGFLIIEVFLANLAPDFLLTREQMKVLLGPALGIFLRHHLHESILELIMHEYTNWTNPESQEEVRLQLIKLFGDLLYGTSAVITARMHGSSLIPKGNYMYHFVANPRFGILKTPEWINGANHGDDVSFITGVNTDSPHGETGITWEAQLSRKMIRYWSNFMKSGDPNFPEPVMPSWPEYNMTSQSYIKLEENMNNKSFGNFLLAKEINIWNNILKKIKEAIDEGPKNENGCVNVASHGTSISPAMMTVLWPCTYFVHVFNLNI